MLKYKKVTQLKKEKFNVYLVFSTKKLALANLFINQIECLLHLLVQLVELVLQLVLQLVRECKVHPTADQVFEMARGKHPTIGRATVYRNLALLADSGQLRRVTLPGQPERQGRRSDL